MTGGNILFTAANYLSFGKPFQNSLTFARKAEAYLRTHLAAPHSSSKAGAYPSEAPS